MQLLLSRCVEVVMEIDMGTLRLRLRHTIFGFPSPHQAAALAA